PASCRVGAVLNLSTSASEGTALFQSARALQTREEKPAIPKRNGRIPTHIPSGNRRGRPFPPHAPRSLELPGARPKQTRECVPANSLLPGIPAGERRPAEQPRIAARYRPPLHPAKHAPGE